MLDKIKNQFPIFKNYPELIYLDSAATSQKPQAVIDRIIEFYTKENANVHRGIYDLSEIATEKYEQARARVAKFLQVADEEVVFTSGTTASANLIAFSYLENNIEEGDVIISSVVEHHSNFLPIQKIIFDKQARLELIKLNQDQDYDYQHLQHILKTEGHKVKAIALSAVSNVLGNKLDIERVVSMVRNYAHDAVIILDAAQIVGHMPFHPAKLDIDFAFFSGHKLFAETGIGVLWGKKEFLQKMPPMILGGGMIDRVTQEKTSFAETPARFEAGTPHVSGAVSMAAAIDFIEEIGLAKIAEHNQSLVAHLLYELNQIPEIMIYGPKDLSLKSSVVAFAIQDIHSHDVAQFLSDRNIAVRAGHHCTQILHRDVLDISGSVRVSFHVYNQEDEITKLISALQECINFYKPKQNA